MGTDIMTAPSERMSDTAGTPSVLDAYAWSVEWQSKTGPVRSLMFQNGVGDYRGLDPQAISKPLYTADRIESLECALTVANERGDRWSLLAQEQDAQLTAKAAECERLRAALEHIANPLKWEQDHLEPGYRIDGPMLLRMLSESEYYIDIARKALKGE